MKIKPYVDMLEKSKEYKDFKIKYPSSFMIAGFFVIDFEAGKNIHQIDFYVPSEKKIAAFTLDKGVTFQLLEMMTKSAKPPEKLDLNTNIDLDTLSGILTDEMRNRSMSENIIKMIAIIQSIEGKKIWNINCVLTGMEILKSHVEDESKTVLKIEKTSLIDIMKKIPKQGLAAPTTKKGVKEEMKKLDKLELEIEKEREKLKQELAKPKKENSKKQLRPNKK